MKSLTGHIRVLFTKEQIEVKVAELGKAITAHYEGKPLTVVGLTNGAMPFCADLIRAIDLPLYVDTLSVASYHADRRGDKFDFRSTLKLNPAGRSVLLVDEVLDSGMTLKRVSEYFMDRGVTDVRTAVMVVKDIPRSEGLSKPDWYGFHAPDGYLVGYGLDSMELYRNLPYIGVLEE